MADTEFLNNRLTRILKALVSDDNALGDKETTASMALAFAMKLQGLKELSFSYDLSAHYLEFAILRNFEDGDLYGSGGMTIGDRKKEMNGLGRDYNNKRMKSGDLIFSSNADPKLKAQFFMRMRAMEKWPQ